MQNEHCPSGQTHDILPNHHKGLRPYHKEKGNQIMQNQSNLIIGESLWLLASLGLTLLVLCAV